MSYFKRNQVILALILIQILFGMNFPASKVIVSEIDPIFWSSIRFLMAGFGMLLITLVKKQKIPKFTKEYISYVCILSILGLALGQGLFLTGLKWTTSLHSALITSCIPIWTLIIVVLRKQEDITFNKLLGIAFAFFGMIFMRDINSMHMNNNTLIGDSLVLIATICFALYLSFGKNFFEKYNNYWATTFMFFISGIILFIFKAHELESLVQINVEFNLVLCGVYSVFGATLLTYFLNNWALKKTQAANVAVFIYLQPVVAGVIAYFYLGEDVSFRMFVCSLFILTGLFLSVKTKESP